MEVLKVWNADKLIFEEMELSKIISGALDVRGDNLDTEKVCLFTGFSDKKGNKVFSDDIIKLSLGKLASKKYQVCTKANELNAEYVVIRIVKGDSLFITGQAYFTKDGDIDNLASSEVLDISTKCMQKLLRLCTYEVVGNCLDSKDLELATRFR